MFATTNPFPQTRLLEPVSVLRMFLRAQYFLAFCLQCGFYPGERGSTLLGVRGLLCLQCARKFFVCSL